MMDPIESLPINSSSPFSLSGGLNGIVDTLSQYTSGAGWGTGASSGAGGSWEPNQPTYTIRAQSNAPAPGKNWVLIIIVILGAILLFKNV